MAKEFFMRTVHSSYISIQEAANQLGMTYEALFMEIKRGKLKAEKVGGGRLIRKWALNNYKKMREYREAKKQLRKQFYGRKKKSEQVSG